MAAALIASIASLLWPLLVLAALLIFWRPLVTMLKVSDVDLEIGGQKISVKQLSDQQSNLISDLQEQVASLRDQVDALALGDPRRPNFPAPPAAPLDGPPPTGAPLEPAGSPPGAPVLPSARPATVLWVDDHPENNAVMIEAFQREGVTVILAYSTAQALELLHDTDFGAVISDMGRTEKGTEMPTAGLTLLRRVRELDLTLPFVILASHRAVALHQSAAREAGVTDITPSSVRVREVLRDYGVLAA